MFKILQFMRYTKVTNVSWVKSNYETNFRRHFSDSVKGLSHDIAVRFYEPEIQQLLEKLTRMDMAKVFRRRKFQKALTAPEYKFMTTKEVEKEIKNATQRAKQKLQMPPVLPPSQEINEVIGVDKELSGLDTSASNHIFTDISFGTTDRTRVIVVREPDGTLRKAKWNERHRMNQIYFPVPGRKLFPPKLFKQENLLDLCERQEYEFALDFACLQYEPDDSEYHRITSTIYDHVDETQNYELLRSTRHYGPLVFYVATQRTIDNLVVENIQSDRLEDAVWAISLFHLLKPDSKSKNTECAPEDQLSFIKSYIEQDATKRGLLEMTLKSYIDAQNNLPGIQKQAN